MNRILIVFLLFLLASGCEQSPDIRPDGSGLFLKYYGNGVLPGTILEDIIPEGRSLIATPGGDLIGLGTLSPEIDTIVSQAYVFVVDKNGRVKNDRLLGEEVSNQGVDMVRQEDGSIYLLMNRTTHFSVACLNENLETVWEKDYNFLTFNKGRAISLDEEGNLAVMGTYPGPGGEEYMFLARLTAQGDLIWMNPVAEGIHNPVGKSLATFKTGVNQYAWCADDLSKEPEKKPKLIIVDENQNELIGNGTEFDENLEETVSELIRTGTGGFIIIGTISVSPGDTDMRVIAFTSSGNEAWAARFGGAGNEKGYSVCETDDGGFLLAGSTETNSNGETDFYLVKINNKGELLWEKNIGTKEKEEGLKVIRVDDGYAVIGVSEIANTRFITIVRTSLEGDYINN